MDAENEGIHRPRQRLKAEENRQYILQKIIRKSEGMKISFWAKIQETKNCYPLSTQLIAQLLQEEESNYEGQSWTWREGYL